MKRIFVLMLVLIMGLSLIGCGNKISKEFEIAKESASKVIATGKIEGDVYTHEFGIRFEKPENWVYSTEEELAQMESQEGIVYDMFCQNVDTGSQVLVLYEDLLETTGNNTLTEEQYMEVVSNNLYRGGFMIMDVGKKELCGKEYEYLSAYTEHEYTSEAGTAEIMTINQISCLRKEGGVMISVIIMSFGEENIDDIVKYFK